MARKRLVDINEERLEMNDETTVLAKLCKLVEIWGTNKSAMDSYKKDVEKMGAEIKQLMMKHKMTSCSSSGFVANLSFQNKESVDEDGLLAYIKSELWGNKGSMECPYIKRIEVIDWDAIEAAMYNGSITKEQAIAMDKFRTTTKTPVLKLAKIKKEE